MRYIYYNKLNVLDKELSKHIQFLLEWVSHGLSPMQREFLDSTIGEDKWSYEKETNTVSTIDNSEFIFKENSDFHYNIPTINFLNLNFSNLDRILYQRNSLNSLVGCPEKVKSLNVKGSRLINLNGCPSEIDDNFSLHQNSELVSLNGGPSIIWGSFKCSQNDNLSDLRGFPSEIKNQAIISKCINIDLGTLPKDIKVHKLTVEHSGITSLVGIPKIHNIKEIAFPGNYLISPFGIEDIVDLGEIEIEPVTSFDNNLIHSYRFKIAIDMFKKDGNWRDFHIHSLINDKEIVKKWFSIANDIEKVSFLNSLLLTKKDAKEIPELLAFIFSDEVVQKYIKSSDLIEDRIFDSMVLKLDLKSMGF